MRLAMAEVRNLNTAAALSAQVLECGCVAEQLLVLTNQSDPTHSSEGGPTGVPTLAPVLRDGGIVFWAVWEPEYYSGGIRSIRTLGQHYLTCVDQIRQSESSASTICKFLVSQHHRPLVILQLNTNRTEARVQLNALIKRAFTPVEIMDTPAEPTMGSVEFKSTPQN